MKKYKVSIFTYQNSQSIQSNCADITFINNGATSCLVNNFEILPSGSLSIQGNQDEIDTTIYNIIFNNTMLTNNSISVIKRVMI